MVDPPAGLDPIARRVIAELLQYATASCASVLGRAIEEAHVRPPQVPLTAATLLATLKVPFKLIAQRIADRSERRQIERSYDELIAVGKVDHTFGDHEQVVRDLYAEEVLAKRGPPPLASQGLPLHAAPARRHTHASAPQSPGVPPRRTIMLWRSLPCGRPPAHKHPCAAPTRNPPPARAPACRFA